MLELMVAIVLATQLLWLIYLIKKHRDERNKVYLFVSYEMDGENFVQINRTFKKKREAKKFSRIRRNQFSLIEKTIQESKNDTPYA